MIEVTGVMVASSYKFDNVASFHIIILGYLQPLCMIPLLSKALSMFQEVMIKCRDGILN